jgi:hypothetical protein
MRQLLVLSFVIVVIVPIAACAASESLPPPPPSPEPAGPNMSGKIDRRMANCPSAVPGAVTKVELTPGGVDVTVTAPGPEAQRTIVALAQFHARTPKPLDATPHVGLRGGGSRIGFCPLLHDNTTITTSTVPGGVRLHLRADSPSRVKELQAIVSTRVARLPRFPSS